MLPRRFVGILNEFALLTIYYYCSTENRVSSTTFSKQDLILR